MFTILSAGVPPIEGPTALPLLFLAIALVVALVMIYRVLRDVKGTDAEETTEPDELLSPLEDAYAAGQMSEEEYHRIRDSALRSGFGEPRWSLPVRRRPDVTSDADPPGVEPPATDPDPS